MNFNRIFAIVLRHIFTTMHQLERFFDVIVSPVLVLILWGFLSKYVQNIQSSSLAEFLTGLLTISFIKIIIALTSMWLMAGIFYNFQITSLGFGLALLWINLFIFAVSFGIFNVSLVLRYGHTIGPLTWILPFFVQPFAAVFYPISILPPLFQKIAYFIPISHVFEGMRYTLKFGQFDYNSFWTATILNVVYMSASLVFFTFIFKKVLTSGRLVKLI